MENTRTRNAFLNVIIGFGVQVVILVLSFVGRKIFLNYLNIEYLGVNGLFSNILTILSLGEMGLDTVALFTLYKPVSEKNYCMVKTLLIFYRKMYFFIGLAVLGIGCLLIPFLPLIVKSSFSNQDIIIFYILLLINVISSYFVAYKIVLINANQEQRIHKLIILASTVLTQIVHIIVLVTLKNYYAYLIATIICSVLTYIFISIFCKYKYKEFLQAHNEQNNLDKKAIYKKFGSSFLYRLGCVLVVSVDNILISILVNTASVGFYSNYLMVITSIQAFISIITSALISGIGNLTAKGNIEKQKEIFKIVLIFYNFIGALGFSGLFLMFNNFITIWLGQSYLLSNEIVFIISFNFYLNTILTPIWMFRECNGLFSKTKFLILIKAFLNIGLSILLGKFLGIFGILLATSLSTFLTNFWFEPKVLFNDVFKTNSKFYWKIQFNLFVISFIIFVISYCLTRYFACTILDFIFEFAIIVLLFSVPFYFILSRTKKFSEIKEMIKLRFKNRKI